MTRRRPLLPSPARRGAGEPIVPMINVVFLLLIFFLMTARIAPPDALDISLPQASKGAAQEGTVQALYLAADGQVAFGTLTGPAAITAAATGPVELRADAGAPAARLAQVMGALARAGAQDVVLVTEPRR